MSVIWGAITKYHRLGGLNKIHLFLRVLEAQKSKIKVPADSVSGADGRLVAVSSQSGKIVLMSLPLPVRALIPS